MLETYGERIFCLVVIIICLAIWWWDSNRDDYFSENHNDAEDWEK
jgi:hypothetical protein